MDYEERLKVIIALSYEGHRAGSTPETVKACGCVCCRIRHVAEGGHIVPDPRKTQVNT